MNVNFGRAHRRREDDELNSLFTLCVGGVEGKQDAVEEG